MGRKRKILIVDDDKGILNLLDTLLSKSGYEVVSAGNGVEALEKLRKNSIDLIISDILMPEMDGFQFCRECKMDDSLKRIPIIFFSSSYTDEKDQEFAMSLGAAKFLVKPSKLDVILDTLKTVIEECDNSAPERPMDDEEVYLAEYNKRLVGKLEEKVLDLGKEIYERQQAEKRLSAQNYVTQVLLESVTIKDAYPKILQTVCMALEWDFGEIWHYDRQDSVLKCSAIWHIPTIEIPEFKKITKQITFSKGIGLPGRIFSTAEPVWITDVIHDTNFHRASIADKEGLHGAFGFPILSGNEVLGIICFFSNEIRQPNEDLLNMFSAIGIQIGLFIRRKQVEEKINKLSHAIEYSSAMVVITDTEGNIEYVNPRFTQLTGYGLEEVIGKTPRILKSAKTPPGEYKELWEAITSGNEWRGELCNRKKSGELYWESESISPVKNSEGVITNFIAVKENITDRKHAEEQIKTSLKEKETLLMEIHHRVRNNLQVLSSLLLLHTENLKDDQSVKVFKNAQDRIQSMAIIHEILYESNHLSSIDFSQFVRRLTGKLFSSYGIAPDKISLKVNIKNVSLKIEQAVPLGLLVNELFSNSLEHAFPFDKISVDSIGSDQVRQEKYEISISLTPAQDNKIELIVCDNGVGMPKNLDLRTTDSLGLSLVNIIAENQLKGEVALDRSVKGTKFQIIFG